MTPDEEPHDASTAVDARHATTPVRAVGLEICVDTAAGLQAAIDNGADRITTTAKVYDPRVSAKPLANRRLVRPRTAGV